MIKPTTLLVIKPFPVTDQLKAKKSDLISVTKRNVDYFNIVKVNDINVTMIFQKKAHYTSDVG